MLELISVISSALVAVVTLVANCVYKYIDNRNAAELQKKQLYCSNQLKTYIEFVSAYADLHMVKDFSEQRRFLNALYAAIAIAPDDLKEELSKLLPMNSVATIKPTDDNREIFFNCLRLISQHNNKNI